MSGGPAAPGSYGAPVSGGPAGPGGYGAPAPGGAPYGAPGPTGWPAPPATPQRNGFAITSLIFGILPGPALAIGFGIAGLVRAGKVNKGKVMSWIGIALGVLWLVPIIYLSTHVAKALDPGCISAESLAASMESKINADSGNVDAFKQDLANFQRQFNDAAAKSKNAAARDAMKKLAGDFQEVLNDINTGKQLPADMESRLTNDGNAVDTACGR